MGVSENLGSNILLPLHAALALARSTPHFCGSVSVRRLERLGDANRFVDSHPRLMLGSGLNWMVRPGAEDCTPRHRAALCEPLLLLHQ